MAAGVTVNAAGAWAGRLEQRLLAPIHPIRGQGVALKEIPPRFRHVVNDGRFTLVARNDGRLLVGTTREPQAGYDARPTVAAMAELLAAAADLAPSLAKRPVRGAWTGLRPGTPDDLPIPGRSARADGLVWASGHAGTGILLAGLTGKIIAAAVHGQASRVDATPFDPGRFSDPA